MSDWLDIQVDRQHVAREKEKARALRRTSWWRNKAAAGICHYCGRHFPPEELTMDHVVPLSRGGRSVKGNIVPCCRECNSRKKYLTPVEMIFSRLEKEKDRRE